MSRHPEGSQRGRWEWGKRNRKFGYQSFKITEEIGKIWIDWPKGLKWDMEDISNF